MAKLRKSKADTAAEPGESHVVVMECSYTFFVGMEVDGPRPKGGASIPVGFSFPEGMFEAICKLYGWPKPGMGARSGYFRVRVHGSKKPAKGGA